MNIFEFSLSRAIIKSKYTIILTLGAVLGVACLIIVTSLFNNYYMTSEKIFMGVHPHICVQKENMAEIDSHKIARKLTDRFPGIRMAKPALYKDAKAVISKVNKKKFFCVKEQGNYICYDPKVHPGDVRIYPRYGFTIIEKKKQTVLIKGITVENNQTASDIKKIINGSTKLNDLNLNTDENNNILPWSFYMQQDLFPGAVGLKDFLISFPGVGKDRYHLLQKGTLGMGTQKGTYPLLVMSLKNAQECLGRHHIADTIEIKLENPYKAEDLSKEINAFLGGGFKVKTWVRHSKASFAFLRIIKIMILSIIFSISIVAAIGMISTLTLIVMQNKGKIAILKSMGIKNASIYKIFVLNTGLTGVVGVVAGTLLGFLASHYLITGFAENLKKLGIKDPRILLEPQEVLIIGLVVVVLFLLTAIVPSKRAVAADVVEGLQEQQ